MPTCPDCRAEYLEGEPHTCGRWLNGLRLVLGIAMALLLVSTLLVLIDPVFLVSSAVVLTIPLLLVLLFIALLIATRIPRLIADFPALLTKSTVGIVLTAVIVLPAAAYTPFALTNFRLGHLAAAAIPAHPQMRKIDTSADWYSQTATLRFRTMRGLDEVLQFYRNALVSSGWQESSAVRPPEHVSDMLAGYSPYTGETTPPTVGKGKLGPSFTRGDQRVILFMGDSDQEGSREIVIRFVR